MKDIRVIIQLVALCLVVLWWFFLTAAAIVDPSLINRSVWFGTLVVTILLTGYGFDRILYQQIGRR